MSLQSYRRKRRFDKTPEPQPERSVELGKRPLFVVQLHHASRRHYDVRLQVGDVLKSWACPKGPSYDPEVKRLAVEVEDHPVSYAAFEGDIPDGYGAGHVDLFDTGVWSTSGDAEAQLQKGHLRFELFGERLRGGWHLVRSHRKERQPAWFLIKDKDSFVADIEADDLLDKAMVASTVKAAGRSGGAADVAEKLKKSSRKRSVSKRRRKHASAAKLAAGVEGARAAKPSGAFFEPELAVLRESPPVGERWLHEVKWDGYRILSTIENGQVRLWSRNATWEDKIPDIRQAIEALGLQSAHLDGELIALSDGQPDFNALQRTLSGEAASPLAYVLFDMPYLEGFDLSRAPLVARKQALSELLGETPPVHLSYSSHLVGNGEDAFRAASEQHLEGIMCKRVDAPYRGGRGDNWVKVKRLESDEFAMVGYTDAKGSRAGFGSLLLAKPQDGGWYYIGRVGTGFNTAMLDALRKKLDAQKRAKKDIEHTADAPRDAHWIEPTMVAEVFYRGIGNQGLLRQPSLKTMRDDKSPRELLSSDRDAPPARAASSARKRSPAKKAAAITITHPDRIVYPADGYTKQDVADYYKTVMDWFLPGVLKRPTSTIPYPGGIDKPSFFQKHIPTGGLKHVGSARLKEETGAAAVYIYPESPDSIMELVQYNAIEFHPWGAHVETPDIADRVIFDLDPGPDVAWSRVVAAARLARKLLEDLDLRSFVRTTGGKGLHVVVPLNPGSEWSLVKEFAQGFASAMAGAHPLDFTATSTKTLRNKKIYVDYLRNGRGATAVASYSLRGRPGAPAAVPLRWEELGKIKGGNQFDIRSAPARLKRLRKDPWEGIETVRQDLESVLQKLAERTDAP